MFTSIVVGAGYAGAISARILAEHGEKVLLLERRNHIAGNMYDEYDEYGILVHRYGPHISVMRERKCYDFLSRFTEWTPYQHHVNAEIDGKEVPLPFNLNAVHLLFPLDRASTLEKALIEEYGYGANVPILELRKSKNANIRELADYVFEKVFLHYTLKMWGLTPQEIDPSVTARVPVRISYDDRHFLHPIQVMPLNGFTALFKKMLDMPNIEIVLNENAVQHISFEESIHTLLFDGKPFTGKVVYTGALDELFRFCYGPLPYRALKFEFETRRTDYAQTTSVLNWPDDRKYTRRTEMKRLTQQKAEGVTTLLRETPGSYDPNSDDFNEPCYPINEDKCICTYKKYLNLAQSYKNLYPIGRLADYKYYNMEDTILRTLDFWEKESVL